MTPDGADELLAKAKANTVWAKLKIGDSFLLPPESCQKDGEFAGMPVKIENICMGNCEKPAWFHFMLRFPDNSVREAFIGPWCPCVPAGVV